MTSPRPSGQNRSNSGYLSENSDGDSEPVQRSQLSSDPVNIRNKQGASPGASGLARQPGQFQNRPVHVKTVPEQQNQIRPPANLTRMPQVPQTARMTSPQNLQTVRHGLQHQKLPQLAASKYTQQTQNLQNRPQQQRPASSHQSSTAAASPGKRMETANLTRPSLQSPASRQQNPSPAPNAEQTSLNKGQEPITANKKPLQPQLPPRVKYLPKDSRPLPPQSQHKVFSVPQNQEPHPKRQKLGDKAPQRHPPGYDEEGMYYDDEDDDYNEEFDEEEMQYPGIMNSFGYDFNSSDEDDDELSEEESALLEELRFCEDDERYSQIVGRLHEKGIDPEEIEELLYHSSQSLGMYGQGNFPADASGEENEAEGTVSSSSQSQLPQMRHHSRGLPAPGHIQSGASTPASTAAAFNKKQTGPSGVPSTSNVGRGQQRIIPRQMQQQVSGSGHASPQGPSVLYQQRQWGQKQQLDSKLAGQPKKIFQNSPSQSTPVQGGVRQPQDKEASQLFMEDSDSSGEDDAHIGESEHTDEQNTQEVNTSRAQLQAEGVRLQTGRRVITVASGPPRTVPASNKSHENQTCNRPGEKRDIGQKSSSEQVGFVGPSLGQPTGIQGQKTIPAGQIKSAEVPEISQRPQPQNIIRPVRSTSHSGGNLHQLKAVLEKNTAPSEASLARLNVEYMQQSLDLEIKAKKTVTPVPSHLSGHTNLNIRHPLPHHRLPLPLYKGSPRGSNQTSSIHAQLTPPPPKHQLPPRQPIPAIINPNSNITTTSSAGKPVCSVVPFTSENQKSVPKANSAPQNETFVRPQNPVSSQTMDSTNSLSQSPGVLQNRQKPSAAPQSPVPPAAASPTVTLNKSVQQTKTTALSSNQTSSPSQAQPAPAPTQTQKVPTPNQQTPTPTPPARTTVQPAQPADTQARLVQSSQPQAQQPLTQTKQAPVQAQKISTQNQQTPPQNQQTPPQNQQTPPQNQQTPTQTQQAPVQTQKISTQNQQTSSQSQQTQKLSTQNQQTPPQNQQTPTQTTQVQPAAPQAIQPSTQAQLPPAQTQQPQAQTSKADSFSLDRLSKEKCIITGKGKNQTLVANMVYQIRSPINGSYVLALWNGEKFEDLKQTGLATSGTSSAEKLQSEPHSAQGSSGGPRSGQATYVKPLAAGHAQHRPDQAADNPDDEDEDGEDNDDDYLFKKPFVERPKEDYCRECPFCGHTRTNMKRCENCRRIFRGNIKVVHINKQAARDNTPASSVSRSEGRENTEPDELVHKENLATLPVVNPIRTGVKRDPNNPRLGQGDSQGFKECLLTEGVNKGKASDEDNADSDSEMYAGDAERNPESPGSSRYGLEKRPAPGAPKEVAARKRQRRQDDSVTLTISSDEDEPSSTSSSLLGHAHAVSPTSLAGSQPPSFLFPPPRPVKPLGKLVAEPAQDEERVDTMKMKDPELPLPQYMYRPGEAEEDSEEDDEEMGEDDDGEEPPMYEIDIRSVRVGSMRTHPEGPLLISLEGVCIKVRSERTEEIFDFEILAHEVEKVKYFLGEIQPVLYLFVTQDCGEKMRAICHMEPGDEEFFDPSSTDMKQKMIVVIIEGFTYMSQGMLRETLSLWADLNQVEDANFIEELTDEQSNDLLIQSAPPVLTMDIDKDLVRFRQRDMKKMAFGSSTFPSSSDNNDNEPDSTSSSPPEVRCHYFGTSVRLLQYPPPPAKRLSITTEDLFCLTEGEFLNDVIIDFYLQYLYLEKLSEENRKRTHIFSSFFYKRLMQKDRHDRSEEDAKKSLPERRHARVRKWTKTVDLFSKDFIVIPINENSHWYLAVVCFPGLSGPEAVQYIPSADHMDDLDEETEDVPGEAEKPEGHGSRSSAYRTILGQQLDEKDCLNMKDIKPLVGQKQPCILMFDSLAGPSRLPNVRILREYLQCEWNAKKSEPRQITKILRNCTPDVPQQSNFSDCGVYLLQYVESFFEDPIADFEIPMEGLEHWFPEEIVHNKRREIHELIMSLHRQYQMERGDPNILDLQFESTPREPPARFYPDYMSGHEEEMNYEPHPDMMSGLHDDGSYDASYEMNLRQGEDLNYDSNYEMSSRRDGDTNYDPNCEMSSRPDKDIKYDPKYEMTPRPDEDTNYETNRDLENSNSELPEESNEGEDSQTDLPPKDKQA